MKNKGRRHKCGKDQTLSYICNTKSYLVQITRPIEKMNGRTPHNHRGMDKSIVKKYWSKRVRGYFKSQTKDILFQNESNQNNNITF